MRRVERYRASSKEKPRCGTTQTAEVSCIVSESPAIDLPSRAKRRAAVVDSLQPAPERRCTVMSRPAAAVADPWIALRRPVCRERKEGGVFFSPSSVNTPQWLGEPAGKTAHQPGTAYVHSFVHTCCDLPPPARVLV